VPCAVHPDKTAKPKPEWTARFNWEVFMFSSAKARKAFDRDPLRYCGMLTDPVSEQRFQPNAESPWAVHNARKYYFQSEADRATFVAAPDSFAARKKM